jgi:3alpha(or 20beta)-hydroxysteroid dehydrogenase
MGRLDGRVTLVTGGARGMGGEESRLFAAEGAKVIIADVRVEEGRALADEIGEAAHFVELDVSDEEAWDEAMKEADARFGQLHVLVNNAGITDYSPLTMTTTESYMRVFAVNQLGVFLGMRTAAPLLKASGGGSIINVSSVDGLGGSPMAVSYCATKFAVRGMTKVAALEFASAGIRVNSIHPGIIRTPLIEDSAPGVDVVALCEPSIPLRRIGEPEEVARLALFLASPESSYCTGAEFVVDGGIMAGLMMDPGPDFWDSRGPDPLREGP